MKASTLQNRIDSNLRTKGGAIAVKYQNVEKVLMGNRYHGAGYSGHGRYISKANGDHFAVIEGLRKIGVDFVEGNDAPRGGWSGQYVELSPKGKRQVAEWAKDRKDAKAKALAERKAKDIADVKAKFETLKANPDTVAACFPEMPKTYTDAMGEHISTEGISDKRHSLAHKLHLVHDTNFQAAFNFYYLKDKYTFAHYNYIDGDAYRVEIKYSDIAE